MNTYIALIRTNLRLTMRDRSVVFFNYLFPLIFFFLFAQMMHADQGGMIVQVVSMVLTIGVLGSGLFGAGMRAVMEEALRAAGRGTVGYHVSLDMDWIDPEDAPGVGTPVRGGATYREAHLAMEILADHGRLLSFEIVEVNPVIDEHNRTADLAVELACSAFGKKIL